LSENGHWIFLVLPGLTKNESIGTILNIPPGTPEAIKNICSISTSPVKLSLPVPDIRMEPVLVHQKEFMNTDSNIAPQDLHLSIRLYPDRTFGKGSDISGVIITNHDLDIKQVQIMGHVWARTIITHYNGSSFTNYLINSTISKADNECFFPLLGALPARIRGTR